MILRRWLQEGPDGKESDTFWPPEERKRFVYCELSDAITLAQVADQKFFGTKEDSPHPMDEKIQEHIDEAIRLLNEKQESLGDPFGDDEDDEG